jgi:hypothetical protein
VSGGARGAHMHDSTRVIWRLVRDAGKAGIALDELVARQPLGRQETRSRLQTLTRSGYCTRKDGDGGFTWFEGEHCVPGEEPGGDDDTDDGFPPPAPAPKGPPAGVPSCVWDLGKVPALSADATPLATAKRPDAVPPAPPPAPLPNLRRLREELTPGVTLKDGTRLTVVPGRPPAPEQAKPRFELHSDGCFLIDPAGDGTEPITLQPTVTRAMFRWLDQLAGLSLQRLAGGEQA